MIEWLKRKAAYHFGEEEGKQMPKRVVDWMLRNKKLISGPFLAITTWAFFKECPPLVLFDIPLSPTKYMTCNQIDIIISALGGILVGAGALDSDSFHRAMQGKSNVEVTLTDKNTGEETKKL